MENNQKNQLNIEISDEVAEGKYSNLAIITHSPNEFIVDFAQMMPGTLRAAVWHHSGLGQQRGPIPDWNAHCTGLIFKSIPD